MDPHCLPPAHFPPCFFAGSDPPEALITTHIQVNMVGAVEAFPCHLKFFPPQELTSHLPSRSTPRAGCRQPQHHGQHRHSAPHAWGWHTDTPQGTPWGTRASTAPHGQAPCTPWGPPTAPLPQAAAVGSPMPSYTGRASSAPSSSTSTTTHPDCLRLTGYFSLLSQSCPGLPALPPAAGAAPPASPCLGQPPSTEPRPCRREFCSEQSGSIQAQSCVPSAKLQMSLLKGGFLNINSLHHVRSPHVFMLPPQAFPCLPLS